MPLRRCNIGAAGHQVCLRLSGGNPMIVSSAVLAAAPTGTQTTTGSRRYLALDAYRGFIMLLLVSEGFGFSMLKGDPTWDCVAGWFDHVPGRGWSFGT